MADFAAIQAVVNGNLEMGVNMTLGAPASLTGNDQLAGTSNGAAAADHTHLVRGFEQLSADPTSGNFEGRMYLRSGDDALRECTDASGSGTFITIGNLTAADLPNHAANHKTGGVDALASNTVDNTMMARTLTSGVPAGDVSPASQNAWTDVITGVTPTITGTQIATIIVSASWASTSVSGAGLVAFRVMNGGTLIAQTGQMQTSVSGGANDQQFGSFVWTASFSASPTLKLQVNTVSFSTALTVYKTQTINSSAGSPTRMDVIVG
jgi:hypothetical protein